MAKSSKKYSIIELELCGLAINIVSFAHLSKKVDSDAIVDNLALTHIIKGKSEPATNGIKKIVKGVKFIYFQPDYIKCKVMILSDFYIDRNMMKVILMRSY